MLCLDMVQNFRAAVFWNTMFQLNNLLLSQAVVWKRRGGGRVTDLGGERGGGGRLLRMLIWVWHIILHFFYFLGEGVSETLWLLCSLVLRITYIRSNSLIRKIKEGFQEDEEFERNLGYPWLYCPCSATGELFSFLLFWFLYLFTFLHTLYIILST